MPWCRNLSVSFLLYSHSGAEKSENVLPIVKRDMRAKKPARQPRGKERMPDGQVTDSMFV
jgi:hypothetical protein